MTTALQATLDLLDLEVIERNLFRGHSPRSEWQRVFGGQVIGQALSSAARTIEGRICHSLHAYFLRPGDPNIPIVYEVDPIRDGRSFTTRRVRAIQHGHSIFSMEVSFQTAEQGVEHQLPMPNVTPPEDLPSVRERLALQRAEAPSGFSFYFEGNRAFEDRTVDAVDPFRPEVKPPNQHTWMKPNGKLPDDLTVHQCMFAYMSDYSMSETSWRPHGLSWAQPGVQTASLDHAIWFHRPFKVDQWLLFDQDSPAAFGSRAASRACVYDRSGVLVASVFQESLIRTGKG